jgi:hypothetical protein
VRNVKYAARRLLPLAGAAIALAGPTAIVANAYAATTSATVRVAAADDAYTSSSRQALNTGTADKLVAGRLDGDSMVTYLKFKVDSSGITKAVLKLTRDEHHLPSSVRLSAVANTTWSERTLTARSAPAPGATIASAATTSSTVTVSFDVTRVVKAAGTYAFAVTSPATNDVARFRSAEYGTDGPSLELTVTKTTIDPVTTPTAKPITPGPCTVDTKLVPSCGVLWGAAAGGFTDAPRDDALRAWEQASGRTSSIYHTYHKGDELFPTKDEIAMAREAGRTRLLMLNWKVAYGSTWAKVAAGEQDARIDREAAYLKANFTEKFFLVIHHEPENDVNTTVSSGMTAKDYAAMFRHTVQRLRADGITNAVSVVAYMSYEKWNNSSWWYDLYPGDDVVDWIGVDAYVSADPNGFHHGDFNYLVNRTTDATKFPGYYTWVTKQHPNKPFILAEWGVFEYKTDPTQKAAIFASVLPALKNLPAIKGIVYFDAPNPPGGGDTRIDSTPEAKAAFSKLAADPLFVVKVG